MVALGGTTVPLLPLGALNFPPKRLPPAFLGRGKGTGILRFRVRLLTRHWGPLRTPYPRRTLVLLLL